MLKALTKKQLHECFRSYFVNPKTGKARSKGKMISLFIVFAVLMLFLGSIGFGMTYLLGDSLYKSLPSFAWLLYTVMGTCAILFGVFGSVFNTYASLYLPKDNDFLLSMPIRPSMILLSRVMLVYLLAMMYTDIVWIPAIVCVAVLGYATPAIIGSGIVLAFVLPLFVSVITCALGWVIAMIATRIRSKSIITVILSLAFFVVYYYFCFNMSDLFEKLVENLTVIGASVQKYGGLLYTLGLAGSGSGSSLALFTAVTLALTAVVALIMVRTYMRLLLLKPHAKKAKFTMQREKMLSVRSALLKREFSFLGSSSSYMINAGFGVLLMPVMVVLAVIFADKLKANILLLTNYFQWLQPMIPAAITAIVCLIAGMNCFTLPSVSLEGKRLWILQTLPVSGRQVLCAKRDLHILLNAVASILLLIVLDVIFGATVPAILVSIVFTLLFIWFTADFGLLLGLRHVNLHWTSEIVVIKQNMFILVEWIANIAILALLAAGCYLLREHVSPLIVTAIVGVIVLAVTLLLEKWLRTKGSRTFETL